MNKLKMNKQVRFILVWFLISSMLLGIVSSAAVSQAASAKISAKSLTLNAGKSKKLKIKNAKGTVKWSSANKKIASVSAKGKVKARKEGKTTIIARNKGKRFSCKVTVKSVLNSKSLSLSLGDTYKLKVLGAASRVTWTGANKQVVKVTKAGKYARSIKAKGVGTTKITAKVGKKKLTCIIMVSEGEQPSDNNAQSDNGNSSVQSSNTGNGGSTVTNNEADEPVLSVGEITFTNTEIETTTSDDGSFSMQSISTAEDSIIITGKVAGVTQGTVEYALVNGGNTIIDTGKVKVTGSFSIPLKPAVGTNLLTVSMKDVKGNEAKAGLYILKSSSIVEMNKSVKEATPELVNDFNMNFVAVNTEERADNESSPEDTTTYIQIIFDRNSKWYEKYISGDINKGDIINIPASEEFPTGMMAVLIDVSNPDSEDYPSSDYVQFEFRRAALEEVMSGEGAIEYGRINKEDPVAFILMADGTDLANDAAAMSFNKQSLESEDGPYTRQFFPEGFGQTLKPSVSVKNDKVNVSLKAENLMVFDEDKDKNTKNDRLYLEGEIGIKDLTADGNVDWDAGGVKQIYFEESYTTKMNLTLKVSASDKDVTDFSISDMVKEFNQGFKNEASLAGIKINGVNMSDRLLLGVVGINLVGVPSHTLGMGMSDYAELHSADTIMFAAIYMDLDGSIKVSGKATLEYSKYHEDGMNIQRNNVLVTKYGNGKTYDTTEKGAFYTVSKYSHTYQSKTDKTAAAPTLTLDIKGEAKFRTGLGIMGGVMMFGFVPADAYAEITVGMDGTLEGSMKIHKMSTDGDFIDFNGFAEFTIASHMAAGVECCITSKDKLPLIGKIGIDLSVEAKKEIFSKSFCLPLIDIKGNITGKMEPTDEKELVQSDVEVYLYDKGDLEVNANLDSEAEIDLYDTSTDGKLITPDYLENNSKWRIQDTKSDSEGNYVLEKVFSKNVIVEYKKDGYVTAIESIKLDRSKINDRLITKDVVIEKIRNKNWLDVLKPYEYGGSARMELIGDSPDVITMSGVDYHVGFALDGGDKGFYGGTYAMLNLEEKYKSLRVRVGHVDDTHDMTNTIYVYLDGSDEPSETFVVSPLIASKEITINFEGASIAKIYVKATGGYGNFRTGGVGFVEGVWTKADGSQEGTMLPYDQFDDIDMTQTDFMKVCPPCFGDDLKTIFDTPESTSVFTVAGVEYRSGFSLSTESVIDNYGPYCNFFTRGKFESLTISIGKEDGRKALNSVLYVYLDDETEPSTTIELDAGAGAKTYTIPVNNAQSVTFRLKNVHDNWTTTAYCFVDGKWN